MFTANEISSCSFANRGKTSYCASQIEQSWDCTDREVINTLLC